MIEYLKEIEQQILLFINGAHSPILDEIMWWVSDKFVWIPLYLFLIFLVFKKFPTRQAIWFVVFGIIAIGICDSTATYLFKYNVARYRPSHHLIIGDLLHYYEIKLGDLYKGGLYGFISSHAGNSTVLAVFFTKRLKSSFKFIGIWMSLWVLLIVYSRMYLGVHYPTDILGGIIWGLIIANLTYWSYSKLIR